MGCLPAKKLMMSDEMSNVKLFKIKKFKYVNPHECEICGAESKILYRVGDIFSSNFVCPKCFDFAKKANMKKIWEKLSKIEFIN
jgi:hypothetical protein